MPQLSAPVLANDSVRLEPLRPDHAAGLREAAAGAAAGIAYARVPEPDEVEAFVAETLERAATGLLAPFAQIDVATGRALGQTCYLTPRWWPGSDRLLGVEIGGTWLAPAARGTAVNSAAKLLLLDHAFEVWGVSRVDLKTDARNALSRAGIVAIGARFEGVLRGWQPSAAPGEEGHPRDTAMHSITAEEWPDAKARLRTRLAAKLG